MKKVILVLGFMSVASLAHAQFDSVAIVQQHTGLRNNISSYTNQPFSMLYNALAIKPRSVSGFSPNYNRFVEFAHKFYYQSADSLRKRNLYIYVEWETPIPESETSQYQPHSLRDLDMQEYSIYANKIVKKLQLFPDPMLDENGILMKKKPEVKKTVVKKKVK